MLGLNGAIARRVPGRNIAGAPGAHQLAGKSHDIPESWQVDVAKMLGTSCINGGFNGKIHYKWRVQWENHL